MALPPDESVGSVHFISSSLISQRGVSAWCHPNLENCCQRFEVFIDPSELRKQFPNVEMLPSTASLFPSLFPPSLHHGYQRAGDLISGQGLNGPLGSPVFACAGKTDPPSRLILSQTSVG